MMDRLMMLLACVVMAGFLGILVFRVGRIDLGIVAGLTLAFAVWDMVRTARRRRR